MPNDTPETTPFQEKRQKIRSVYPSDTMLEIKFPGAPLYQLKIRDLSENGVCVVVKPDSPLLKLIELGQNLNVSLIVVGDSGGPCGKYQSIVEHISEVKEGPFHGNLIIGLSFHKGFHSV
jgi:hypothetical protein